MSEQPHKFDPIGGGARRVKTADAAREWIANALDERALTETDYIEVYNDTDNL